MQHEHRIPGTNVTATPVREILPIEAYGYSPLTAPTLYLAGLRSGFLPAGGAVLVFNDQVIAEFALCLPAWPGEAAAAMGLLAGAALDYCCYDMGGPLNIRYWMEEPGERPFTMIAYVARNAKALAKKGEEQAVSLDDSPHLQRAHALAEGASERARVAYPELDTRESAVRRGREIYIRDLYSRMLEEFAESMDISGPYVALYVQSGEVFHDGDHTCLPFIHTGIPLVLMLDEEGEEFLLDTSRCEDANVAQFWEEILDAVS